MLPGEVNYLSKTNKMQNLGSAQNNAVLYFQSVGTQILKSTSDVPTGFINDFHQRLCSERFSINGEWEWEQWGKNTKIRWGIFIIHPSDLTDLFILKNSCVHHIFDAISFDVNSCQWDDISPTLHLSSVRSYLIFENVLKLEKCLTKTFKSILNWKLISDNYSHFNNKLKHVISFIYQSGRIY